MDRYENIGFDGRLIFRVIISHPINRTPIHCRVECRETGGGLNADRNPLVVTLSVIGVGSPGRSSSGSVPGISSRFILGYMKVSGDSPPIMLSLPSRQPIFVSMVRLHVEPTASCC